MLRNRLTDALGRTSLQPVILVGAGNLGSALLRYEEGFAKEGFEIAAAFDAQPKKRSSMVKAPVFPLTRMGKFVSEHGVKMAILCVPGTVAQEICNNLVGAGIQAILNFAPDHPARAGEGDGQQRQSRDRARESELFHSMSVLAAPEFDLRLTLASGQVFHWQPDGAAWIGLIGESPVRLEQRGDELHISRGRAALVSRYFALDHPLKEIYATFPDDAFSRAALEAYRGLRVIRQPRWECLATFLTSAMKQVSHIRAMSLALRERFGCPAAKFPIAAYPRPEVLARADEADLRACGLGFRAPNLRRTAQWIADGRLDLDALAAMETERAMEELCRLPGVGRKIANCVLLFAYERLDAVPVDVWIARVARSMKGGGSLAELEAFFPRAIRPLRRLRAAISLPPRPRFEDAARRVT